jgi:hypothetical protein
MLLHGRGLVLLSSVISRNGSGADIVRDLPLADAVLDRVTSLPEKGKDHGHRGQKCTLAWAGG